MFHYPSSRWAAFGIHLAISFVIFFLLAALIVFWWYPGFLFQTDGGWQGIRVIAGIDLILGPLLTLIVYNRQKKSLRFDLSCIAVVQIVALAYGTTLVYQERPLAVIFADNSFVTVSPNSFNFHGIDYQKIDIIKNNKTPVWIYVEKNENTQQLSQLEYFERFGPPHLFIAGYQPMKDRLDRIESVGLRNIKLDGETLAASSEQARFYPLLARYYEGYLLINTGDGTVLAAHMTKTTNDYGIGVQ